MTALVHGKTPGRLRVAMVMRAVLISLGLVVALVVVFGPVLRAVEAPAEESPAPLDAYDPVAAGERTPSGFRQLLARDGIRPIYEPAHVEASEVQWDDDTLVIGVALDGHARAYPVQTLTRREMVNDHLGDTPILATW